jgi:hypothetical protein
MGPSALYAGFSWEEELRNRITFIASIPYMALYVANGEQLTVLKEQEGYNNDMHSGSTAVSLSVVGDARVLYTPSIGNQQLRLEANSQSL